MAIVFVAFAAQLAQAQKGYNFDQFDIGVSANSNQVYGDAESRKSTFSGAVNLNYNITPYANIVAEFQAGTLAGGDSLKYRSGRQFKSNYKAFILRGQLQAGEIMDYSTSSFKNALKGLYISSGIGLSSNDIKYAARVSNTDPPFFSPGKNSSNEFFVPVRIGYELKLFNAYNMPTVKFDIGYQANIMLGENLDGYNTGAATDIWQQLSIGVKLSLGGSTSYRKSVSYYYQ